MEAYNFAKKELEKHYGPSKDTVVALKAHGEELKRINNMSDKHVTKDLFNTAMKGLKELFGTKLDNIEKQTTKTNGSVAEANKQIIALRMWKHGLVVAWGVVTMLFPTLAYFYIKSLNVDINTQIDKAVSSYTTQINEEEMEKFIEDTYDIKPE